MSRMGKERHELHETIEDYEIEPLRLFRLQIHAQLINHIKDGL